MLRSVLVSTTLLAAAGGADAQGPHDRGRGGLWTSLGFGVGSANATCSVCAGRATGPAASIGVGGTISQKVLVSVQGTGSFEKGAGGDRSVIMLAALGTLYPWRDVGLHVEAGIGRYWYVEDDSAMELSTQGLALQVSVGFDLRITRNMSLSPFASLVTTDFGNPTRLDKATGSRLPLLSNMTVRYYEVGVAATLH